MRALPVIPFLQVIHLLLLKQPGCLLSPFSMLLVLTCFDLLSRLETTISRGRPTEQWMMAGLLCTWRSDRALWADRSSFSF